MAQKQNSNDAAEEHAATFANYLFFLIFGAIGLFVGAVIVYVL